MWTVTVNGCRAMPSAVMDKVLPDFAGLVLAGGASSRMGQDKALLVRDGRTLLEQAVQVLSEAGANPVLVSGNRPAYDCVPDDQPGLGPLSGLLSVLQHRPGLMHRLLVVMPVDTPGLTATALRDLAGAVDEERRGACFQGHPLPLAFRPVPELIGQIRALLADGDKASVRRLCDLLAARELEPGDHDLSNVNTPADWHGFSEVSA
jgi:molybdenum cofactor guanylyltransferase